MDSSNAIFTSPPIPVSNTVYPGTADANGCYPGTFGVFPEDLIPQIDWDTFRGIKVKVGDDVIVVSRGQFVRAMCKMFPDFLSRFTAAKLVSGRI